MSAIVIRVTEKSVNFGGSGDWEGVPVAMDNPSNIGEWILEPTSKILLSGTGTVSDGSLCGARSTWKIAKYVGIYW